ncbi:redoxin domain-containing protein [Limibacter armeniacum]|uniref:redoxin domain-containing protein n=1 Tax=Limibacter armeniacum TaxID=466084 RepID=UPI002FE5620B
MKKVTLILSVAVMAIVGCGKTAEKSADTQEQEVKVATATEASAEETQPAGYSVGDEATDFRLKNIDGTMVSMNDFADAKGFIVIFTCNHCPYAVAYEDRIIELDKQFKDKGYPVIAINPNDPSLQPEDSFDKMKERASDKGFTFPYLFDEGQEVYPVYGATRTPHVYLLNKENNKLVVKYIGAIDNNYKDASKATEKYVADAVEALVSGTEVSVAETKAIGCSIKAQ